jgi:hypothetical protein
MTRSRTAGIVLLAVATAAGAWVVGRTLVAGEARRPGQARWQYAQLYLGDGDAVLTEAGRQAMVIPPRNRLSGNVTRPEPSGEKYTLSTKTVRSHDIGALNVFGSQGWEAVSITAKGKGLLVLLKRAY